jgi:hypothetical protein
MAITTTERTQIIELVTLMFNAAPGATYLSDIVSVFEANGHNLQALAETLGQTGIYQSLNPNFQTATEFAASFLTPLGLQNDAFAVDFVVSRMNSGVSKADIEYQAFQALSGVTSSSPSQYVNAQAIMVNKAEVAEYYSVDANGHATDISTLQNVLGSVTADPASVTAAEAVISGASNNGQTFTLSTAIDNVVGTSGNDLIIGSMDDSGSTTVNTFSVGDTINGGAGNDTLQVTTASTGTVDLRTVNVSNVENLIINDSNVDLGTVYLGQNTFQNVTVQNADWADIYNTNEGTNLTAKALGGTGTSGSGEYFYFNPTSATSVTMNDTFQGAAGATDGYAEFDHGYDGNSSYTGLSAATTITANLNLVNANAFNSNYDWAEQYIYADNAGNAGATITANVNVSGATSDGTEYAGTDTYVYQAGTAAGTATVTANVSISNSDSVYVDVYADEGSDGSGATDVANVTLNNVTDTYDETNSSSSTGVQLGDFETVNVNVTGAAEIGRLYTYEVGTTAFTAQTVNVNASADLTVLGTFDMANSGSNAVVVTGSGNVNLGTYDGTQTALSSTVKDTVDASALTGNFTISVASNTPLTSLKSGAGNDKVTIASAISATESVDLGAGDDTLNATGTIAGGATLTGGAGTDTIGMNDANWTLVSAFSATNLAKISGWENLYINDSTGLVTGHTYDLSLLSGVTGFMANGVAAAGAATVTHVGNGATVTLQGDLSTNNGTLTVTMADATGTSDVLNLVAKPTFTQNNNGTTVDTTTVTETVSIAGVETLNFTSTGKMSGTVAVGSVADNVLNVLALTDSSLKTLNITGDQSVSFTATNATKVAAIDASGNTGTAAATIDVSASTKAVTIAAENGAKNTLVGSAQADTIVGGAKADTITGGLGGDTLNGGAGNDTFKYITTADSTLLNLDTINGFSANTWGQGVNSSSVADGSATKDGADPASTKLSGDLIDLTGVEGANTFIKVGVQTNSSDAQTFLQNMAADTTHFAGYVGAALDSSSGNLYLDVDNNGTADMVIHLAGVTTLNESAFIV